MVAISIGIAGTLVWQSYGETTKHVIATRTPELGWSPESKQMIASWVDRLGWTEPSADRETAAVQATPPQAATATAIASNAPAAPSVNPEQVHEIALAIAAMRQSLDQIASGQDQMAREIARLQTAEREVLEKIPAPPRQPVVVPARKPISVLPSSSSRSR
jgi:hypothetical protein